MLLRLVGLGCLDMAWRVRELTLQKVRCPVERRSGFIEEPRKTLEHMRDAGGDLEGDCDVRQACSCGKPERVAEEDLVRPHLDEQRRQSAEVAEDRADERVSGVGRAYIVGNARTKPSRLEDCVAR